MKDIQVYHDELNRIITIFLENKELMILDELNILANEISGNFPQPLKWK